MRSNYYYIIQIPSKLDQMTKKTQTYRKFIKTIQRLSSDNRRKLDSDVDNLAFCGNLFHNVEAKTPKVRLPLSVL
jgi:hypothetical protein